MDYKHIQQQLKKKFRHNDLISLNHMDFIFPTSFIPCTVFFSLSNGCLLYQLCSVQKSLKSELNSALILYLQIDMNSKFVFTGVGDNCFEICRLLSALETTGRRSVSMWRGNRRELWENLLCNSHHTFYVFYFIKDRKRNFSAIYFGS